MKIYRSKTLSLTLQRSVAQAINIRMAMLYTGPTTGPTTAVDESVWPGVVASQSQASDCAGKLSLGAAGGSCSSKSSISFLSSFTS